MKLTMLKTGNALVTEHYGYRTIWNVLSFKWF